MSGAYNAQADSFGIIAAAADLSSKQYYAVALGASGWNVVSTAGAATHGVLKNAPASGGVADVACSDIAPAILGGTVARGDSLTVDSSSRLVTSTKGDDVIVAEALEAGVVNDVKAVLVGVGRRTQLPSVISIPVVLSSVADGDVVTTYTPGFAGQVAKLSFCVTSAVTTAAKASTLNIEIGTTNLTGGSLALTSANCTPLGAVIDATAITAANTFTATDTISVEASSTTAFIEGEGVLLIVIK